MVPELANNEDWYNWRVANWGTKWSISDVYFENATEQDMIEFSFCSAWTPPTEAFRTWADSDGRVEFRLEYWEPGVAFVGIATYDGEAYMDDSVDMNTDPAQYRRRASEAWGYEEYEEPEPLTEWYQHGVKQKGLA